MKKIHVMMSAYNGETYLERQLDSIFAQKGVDVFLHVRDDGSRDGTAAILRRYEAEHPNMSVTEGENLGYIRSFMWLVNHVPVEEGAFYAFSDQDDVWEEEKLLAAVTALGKMDPAKPLMYYSDLKVVDSEENFIRMANTWESTIDKYKYAVFIGIRGCTMVFNDVLEAMLAPYEVRDIPGHDIYVALAAFWLGQVVYDPNAYILYRQTGGNLSITGTSSFDKFKKNLIYVKKRLTVRKCLHERNAKELLSHYGADHADELRDLREVAEYRKSFRNRMRLLTDRKFKKFSLLIRLFNDLFILLGKL